MKNTVRIIAAAVICVVIGSVFALTAFAEKQKDGFVLLGIWA